MASTSNSNLWILESWRPCGRSDFSGSYLLVAKRASTKPFNRGLSILTGMGGYDFGGGGGHDFFLSSDRGGS